MEHLHLAPNAVVLLHHLCYASGNTEPGLSEGTEAASIQRVDNYAAGFIAAGAKAVVAEAHLGPAYYVRALLRSQQSIEQIWRASPNNNGNTFAVASQRSPGFSERLDPDRPSGGFYRSLVSQGLSSTQMRATATGTTRGTDVVQQPVTPSLVGAGLSFGQVSPKSMPIAAVTSSVTLPIPASGLKHVPAGTQVGVRWDPILLDPAPSAALSPPASSPPPTAPLATVPPASPDPAASATPSATAPPDAAGPTPSASPLAPPPEVDLVVPEQLGTVVSLQRATRTGKGLSVGVTYPSAPGLYRLVMTIHDASGIAYDASTQAMLRPGHRAGRRRVHGGLRRTRGPRAPDEPGDDDRGARRQRGLPGVGCRLRDAAARVRLAPQLAADVAHPAAPRRDVGLDLGHGGARPGVARHRPRGRPARAARPRSPSTSSRRRSRASTCSCSTS